MTVKVIHAADLHLDSPFKGLRLLPAPVAGLLEGATLKALSRIIDIALREEVDAVVFAGDLSDRKDRSIRARLHLSRELGRLHERGIPSFVVHGNHDPLSDDPGGVKLPASTHVFGATWEEREVRRDGRLRLRVQGVSYPEAVLTENLARRFSRQGSEPTLGLLHANVGGEASGHANYAPCTLEDLAAADLDYWALGHVHTRAGYPLRSGGLAVYPGNPQGRHINEPGPRGCVLVELDEERRRAPRHQFFACDAVRWHRLELDIAPLSDLDALVEAIAAAFVRAASDAPAHVEGHLARVVLTGRGALHRQLGSRDDRRDLEEAVQRQFAQRPWGLESISVDTLPDLELDLLEKAGGLAGELAAHVHGPVDELVLTQLLAPSDLEALQKALRKAGLPVLDLPALVSRAALKALELIVEEEP